MNKLFLIALCAVAALNAQLDNIDVSFGDKGTVETLITSSGGACYALGLQSNGVIVAGGQVILAPISTDFQTFFIPQRNNAALVFYNADGSFLRSVFTPFNDNNSSVNDLFIKPDNSIVTCCIISDSTTGGALSYGLAFYAADGSLTSTVTPQVGLSIAQSFALLPITTETFVCGGQSNNGSADVFTLGFFDMNGNLTKTVQTEFPNGNSFVRALAQQSDGTIVAGGYSHDIGGFPPSTYFALARYQPDGTFINSTTIDTPTGFTITTLAVLPDDSILAGGGSTNSLPHTDFFYLIKFDKDGNFDSMMPTEWIITTNVNADNASIPPQMILYNDDLILVASGKIVPTDAVFPNITNFVAEIGAFNIDGSPLTTFGDNGILSLPLASQASVVSPIIAQPDGKILVAGAAINLPLAFSGPATLPRYFYLTRLIGDSVATSTDPLTAAIQRKYFGITP